MTKKVFGAYLISNGQRKKIEEILPEAILSQKAVKDGINTNWYKWPIVTRNLQNKYWVHNNKSKNEVLIGNDGDLTIAGALVGVTLKYDPAIFNPSSKYIVFGKKAYFWLNKAECLNGHQKTVDLACVAILEKLPAFDDDSLLCFAKAPTIQDQCWRLVTENCTPKELEMIVPVQMSDKDNYESLTPILEKPNSTSKNENGKDGK